ATWTETRETTNRVQVTNGLFAVQLGAVTPLSASLFSGNDVYFEITLPTPGTATCSTASCATWESAMTPRQKMATSAYAFNSETLDGLDSTAFGQLSAANTWTSTNTFNNAVSINNTVNVQSSSATAFSVGYGINPTLSVDNSSNRVNIGSTTTDANAFLLALDSYNNGTDPTGVNGTMYYNTNTSKFRCYQAGAWTDCIGAGGSGANAALSNLASVAINTSLISDTTNTDDLGSSSISWRAGYFGTSLNSPALRPATDGTSAFKLQNAGGTIDYLTLDTTNSRLTLGTSDTTGTLLVLDTKTNAGDPTGADGAMYYNSALAQYRCYRDGAWEPCGTDPIDRGWLISEEFMGGGTGTAGTIGANGWALATIGTTGTVSYNQAAIPPSATRPGILRLQTSTTINTGNTIYLGTTTGGSTTVAAGQVVKTAVAVSNAGSGQQTMRVGLHTEDVATTAPVSGVWWEADGTANANWRYCYGDGTTATCAASATAIAADTMVRLEIRVKTTGAGTSSADFIINGTTSSVTSVTIDSTTRLSPAISMFTQIAAQRNFYVDYYLVRGDSSTVR
ncbi:MAG: hypothetical protein ABIQ64_00840, partial [Candidatus Saccharimonadales bacterium]